jgi:hypothetical protein
MDSGQVSNQPLRQTLSDTQILKQSSATRWKESTRVPLYFKSWKRWRTEECNSPVCRKVTQLHIHNTKETLIQQNSTGLLHVSKDPSCTSLIGFKTVLSCCPAKFYMESQMPHVSLSHKTKTFLTTHINIFTLPQWEKTSVAPGQPSASQ